MERTTRMLKYGMSIAQSNQANWWMPAKVSSNSDLTKRVAGEAAARNATGHVKVIGRRRSCATLYSILELRTQDNRIWGFAPPPLTVAARFCASRVGREYRAATARERLVGLTCGNPQIGYAPVR